MQSAVVQHADPPDVEDGLFASMLPLRLGRPTFANPWELERRANTSPIPTSALRNSLVQTMVAQFRRMQGAVNWSLSSLWARYADVEIILLVGYQVFPRAAPGWSGKLYDQLSLWFGVSKVAGRRFKCWLCAARQLFQVDVDRLLLMGGRSWWGL